VLQSELADSDTEAMAVDALDEPDEEPADEAVDGAMDDDAFLQMHTTGVEEPGGVTVDSMLPVEELGGAAEEGAGLLEDDAHEQLSMFGISHLAWATQSAE
jgi:hypothetical protein